MSLPKATSGLQRRGPAASFASRVRLVGLALALTGAEVAAAAPVEVQVSARGIGPLVLGVPLAMLQSSNAANYSNSVEAARHFVTITLKRHLCMWEQAIAAKCLTDAGRRTYFAEHQVEGLLRGDSVTRAQFYSSGISDGLMLRSDDRKLEILKVIDGIDDAPGTTTATAPGVYPSKQ